MKVEVWCLAGLPLESRCLGWSSVSFRIRCNRQPVSNLTIILLLPGRWQTLISAGNTWNFFIVNSVWRSRVMKGWKRFWILRVGVLLFRLLLPLYISTRNIYYIFVSRCVYFISDFKTNVDIDQHSLVSPYGPSSVYNPISTYKIIHSLRCYFIYCVLK